MDGAAALEYAGYDLKTQQYDIKYLISAMEKTAQDFESDNLGVTAVRFAHFYKILGAKHFVMGTDGFFAASRDCSDGTHRIRCADR